MTADAASVDGQSTESPRGERVPPHSVLGERYSITDFVRQTTTCDVYAASDLESDGQYEVHVLHPELMASRDLRQVAMDGARAAMALKHPNIVKTLDTRFDGQYCMVVTEPVEGTTLRGLLARRAASGQAGLGARGVINLMDAICGALKVAQDADIAHGMLSGDDIYVGGDGTVRVAGFATGPLAAAAIQEQKLAKPGEIAPETAKLGEPSARGDVFALSMLFYELLVGRPLERGGPRPSAAVPGLNPEMDRLMAVSVSVQPDQRPSLLEFQASLEHAFAATGPTPTPASSGGPSLAQSIGGGHRPSGSFSNAALNVQMLADTAEKWLITKGRMDYGPFSLSEVVEQIRRDEILPGNIIIDNHTGERCNVEDHPILGPVVDKAKQARDDARRANAEVVHAKQEKRRGATLYLFIVAGVAALALIAYFVVTKSSKDKGGDKVSGITTIGEGEFQAKITFPKAPKKKRKSRKKRSSGSSGASGDSGDDNVMDMGDDSVGSERLDGDVINGVIQGKGNGLARCLQRNGGGYVKVTFNIAGATGKANSVRVNGQTSGGMYNCLNKVMRSMKFPTFNGQRTRAEFDMQM